MAIQSTGIQKYPSNQLQSGAPNPYSPAKQSFTKKKKPWESSWAKQKWANQKPWESWANQKPGANPFAAQQQVAMDQTIPHGQNDAFEAPTEGLQNAKKAFQEVNQLGSQPTKGSGILSSQPLTSLQSLARLHGVGQWASAPPHEVPGQGRGSLAQSKVEAMVKRLRQKPDQLQKQEEDVAVYNTQGYAGGGYVKPRGYAGGGVAQGTDTVPAMLTPGEFVVSRPAVRQIGLDNLMSMNARGGGTNRPRVQGGRMYAQGGGKAKPFKGANNNFLVDLATDFQTKHDEANQANIDRYDEMLAGYDTMHGNVMGGLGDASSAAQAGYQGVIGGYGALTNELRGGYGDLQKRTMGGIAGDVQANEAQYANILGGYGDLRDRVLGGMETLGQDQLAESRKGYDESLAATMSQLAARGLGGTTVGASIRQGTDRGYQDAVRGIQESVLARKAAADMGISQAQLAQSGQFQNAREAQQMRRIAADMGISQAGMGAVAGMGQAGLGAQQNMIQQQLSAAQQQAAMDQSISQSKLGAIERREDEHPSFANLMALTQGAAAGGYGQGYGSGGGDPSGMFSINDYFGGGGGGNPYEALAAGLLGHGSDKQ